MQQLKESDKNMINRKDGFTLIEMALVMIIVGLVLGSAASAYTLYLKDKEVNTTNTNTSNVVEAIGAFRASHGRYPCPASLAVARGEPGYGMEACAEVAAVANNSCDADGGLCLETSTATITYSSGGVAFPPENPRVVNGFVPFRSLNLTEKGAYDGYYNRIKYVVTERLTEDDTFKVDGGGIEVLNDQNATVFTSGAMAHFLVISHGENQAGAFTADGVQIPCNATGKDANNCDSDTSAVYRIAMTDTSGGAGQFDDVVRYFTKSDIPLWQQSEVDMWDIHQKPPGYVSFLSAPTSSLAESYVAGKVRAQEAQVEQVCDPSDPANICFPSSAIAGVVRDPSDTATPPARGDGIGMECADPNEFAVGIRNGEVECVSEIVKRCPTGEIMAGINASGELICAPYSAPPAPCPAITVNICSSTASLPSASHGATHTVTGGDNAFQVYECESGTWNPVGPQGGNCVCTPNSQDRTLNCPAGLTGNIIERRVFACPAGTWGSWAEVSRNCTCTPTTETRNQNCQSGFTGTIQQTRNFTCPNGTWTGWVTVTNTCVCTPTTQTRTQNCPSGFTGSIAEQRNFTCPAGTWSAWTQTSNTCACQPDTDTRKINCPAGLSGKINQQRQFTCPAATWGPWTDILPNNCTCSTKKEKRTLSCPAGYTGSIEQEREFQCPAATWSAWTETDNTCTCNSTTETRTLTCPTGQIGSIEEARAFDCSSASWSAWSQISNDCRNPPPVTCRWRAMSSPQFGQPFGLGSPVGTTCSTCGATGACHSYGGPGSYTNYTGCTCQP